MKKFFNIIATLISITFLYHQTAFAEIKVHRDPYGKISSSYSTITVPHDDKFDLNLYFRGDYKTLEYNKVTYPSPSFFISIELVPKNKHDENLPTIRFLERSFSYTTSEFSQWFSSIRDPLKSYDDGGFVYYREEGSYGVSVYDDEVSVYQKYGSYYSGPKINLRFDGAFPDTTGKVRPLDMVSSSNEVLFGAYITRAIALGYTITLSFPYTTDRVKDYDSYTPEEIANFPKLVITIPPAVLSEWQQLAQYKNVGAPKNTVTKITRSDLFIFNR